MIVTGTEIETITGTETGGETEAAAGSITVMIVEEGEEVAVVEVWRGGNLVVVLGNHTGIWVAYSHLEKISMFHIQMLPTNHSTRLRNTGVQKKLL